MNRRDFSKTAAGALAVAAGLKSSYGAEHLPSAPGAQGDKTLPKLSVMLWTVFKELPFEQRLDRVAEAGYRAVELVNEFKEWNDSNYSRAAAKRRSLGMVVDATAGLETGICDPAVRPKFLEEVSKMLPVMEKLECQQLIVLSGNRVEKLSHEEQHRSCVEALKRAAELTAPRGVTLLLENIDPEENPKYYLTSSREGLDIIREVNHPQVKFLYDFYHQQIAEGNLIATLERGIEHIGVVHIADVPGRHEPGTGEINYRSIFGKLADLKFSGYIAMEFLPSGDAVQNLRKAGSLAIESWHQISPSAGRSGA
jgi:hydroxypyruvate isomerase